MTPLFMCSDRHSRFRSQETAAAHTVTPSPTASPAREFEAEVGIENAFVLRPEVNDMPVDVTGGHVAWILRQFDVQADMVRC